MSFRVMLRKVKPHETILPEDHNNVVEAMKELVELEEKFLDRYHLVVLP